MSINENLSELLDYGYNYNLISEEDEYYVVNRILNLIGEKSFERTMYTPHKSIDEILKGLLDIAVQNNKLVSDTVTYRDILSADIMDYLTPRPSTVIDNFNIKYNESPDSATKYFYELSRHNNYIMTERVKKNIEWSTKTEKYGDLGITINLSKPEKDPKDIANAKKMKQTGYPKCLLCKENVGFEGGANHPGRANHRVIPITLGDEQWFLQYSPYVYYNEHCIVFANDHYPMKITVKTFERLLDFVEKFPNYFIGSNSDLPIVGGSILTHNHFQGGKYEFPMAKCGFKTKYKFESFKNIEAGIVNWPLSTVRLISCDKKELINLAEKIMNTWKNYSDEENEILAYTDNIPHNTVTPIARKRNGKFELDIILRNNRTSEEYPFGIFHAHQEYHHIKKEGIGLIEAMGLAILPARLKTELGELTEEKKNEIGIIFSKILENCGVFKDNENGNKGFIKFLNAIK